MHCFCNYHSSSLSLYLREHSRSLCRLSLSLRAPCRCVSLFLLRGVRCLPSTLFVLLQPDYLPLGSVPCSCRHSRHFFTRACPGYSVRLWFGLSLASCAPLSFGSTLSPLSPPQPSSLHRAYRSLAPPSFLSIDRSHLEYKTN